MVQAMQAAYQFIGGLVIVVALGVMIYSNTVQVPFVYDDVNLLELRIPNNYAEMTLREAVSWVRSLPYYTFSLNYRFSGFELGSYHLVNIVLHVVISSVVVWVIWMLSVLTQATRKWQVGS
ncbi:hypothetical protein IH781_00760, partial [Patescibacteria group bacterium]|nr:hypothetical protein [Patescibacteria group bacterium]